MYNEGFSSDIDMKLMAAEHVLTFITKEKRLSSQFASVSVSVSTY